ncbi:thiamine ABC transporter substrate binding subunit [Marinospirillum perlucidum]|uniref:thiamine ABC transporter substrate binding subunit n=1 Tax=Marinospirillum perlucidum TaxID=1982602 RepID=UPI000DF462C5|nr:thiamine ABC transporter substrate binding subunit [Marinospirillum perlucidum]
MLENNFLRAAGLLLALSPFSAVAAEQSLTVYTYSSFTSEWGPGGQLREAFEAECDCQINYISADDGVSLLNRLRLEGASTQADVIVGLDDALIEEAKQLNLVADHQLDLAELDLKAELDWQDEFFIPFDFGYFAFIFDSEKTQPVSSMQELLASDASVIYQDPRTSTPGQGLLIWMQALYGEEVSQAWQTLSEQTVTVTKGWSEAYSLFLEGEADYVLSYTTSPAYHQVAEDSNRYRAAAFSEGHPRQIEVAAVSPHSDQPELARDFLQFLVSQQAQEILPVTNWMLPVIEDVNLPAAFDELIRPQAVGFTPEEIHQQRQAWIREWRSAVSQ